MEKAITLLILSLFTQWANAVLQPRRGGAAVKPHRLGTALQQSQLEIRQDFLRQHRRPLRFRVNPPIRPRVPEHLPPFQRLGLILPFISDAFPAQLYPQAHARVDGFVRSFEELVPEGFACCGDAGVVGTRGSAGGACEGCDAR